MTELVLPNGHYQLNSDEYEVDLYEGHFLALDTETTGTDPRTPYPGFRETPKPFMVTACDDMGRQWCWEGKYDPYTRKVTWLKKDINAIRRLIKKYPALVFHNGPFDIPMLAEIEIDLTPYEGIIHDTNAASHVVDSLESHGLKDLGVKYAEIPDIDEVELKRYLKSSIELAENAGIPLSGIKGAEYGLIKYFFPRENPVKTYGLGDVVRTATLWHFYRKLILEQGLLGNYERERRVLWSTIEMEQRGVPLKKKEYEHEYARITQREKNSEEELQAFIQNKYGRVAFNPRSSKQKTELLFETIGLPVIALTNKGNPSTDQNVMEDYDHMLAADPPDKKERQQWLDARKVVQLLREYSRLNTSSKYLASYEKLRIGYTLHSSYNCWGTRTTRFTSKEPNLQNVGNKKMDPFDPDVFEASLCLRDVFGPPPGWDWYCFDFSQLELRLMAHASQDETLLKILAKGLDRHQITADALGCPRKQAKNINFAWQYGAGTNKLSKMAGIPADEFEASMASAYPGVVNFMDSVVSEVRSRYRSEGHAYVWTLYGYRLTVPHYEPYKGTNYIIQGSAGDLVKNCMITIREYINAHGLEDRVIMLINVHDELVFQVRKGTPKKHLRNIRDIMEAGGDIIGCSTPVNTEIVRNTWGNTEEIAL